MVNQRFMPNFRLANGDGREKPFCDYLAEFNILAIRRVPGPSHGPATRLLRRLLAEYRGAEDVTVRGFDIRSPDQPCETCHGPHIVCLETDLVTICDGDRSIFRQSGVVGYDRFFIVRSVPQQVVDLGSIEMIGRLSTRINPDAASAPHRVARAQADTQSATSP